VTASLVSAHPSIEPLLLDRAQRAKLLEAVVAVVAEHGYAQATVTDVVRVAQVSRRTFYELFDSKEACFSEALRLGSEVLEARVDAAVASAEDWREELRLGVQTYLEALDSDRAFARVYLRDSPIVAAVRDVLIGHYARRYGVTLAQSGHPTPPEEALFLLSAGGYELLRARISDGRGVADLEDVMVGCALSLIGEPGAWVAR
jgi:AcrR family transcriptional regulator